MSNSPFGKYEAYRAVRIAITTGKLVRPEACSDCGSDSRKIEAHHPNGYSEEHALDVQWLCSLCHNKAHRQTVPKRRMTASEIRAAYPVPPLGLAWIIRPLNSIRFVRWYAAWRAELMDAAWYHENGIRPPENSPWSGTRAKLESKLG